MHFILLILQIYGILYQKDGDFVIYSVKTNCFELEYIESKIDHTVLWESHCHAQYEMIAVAGGDITVMLEGQKYRLQKNQIIIIPPLFYHSVTANGEGVYRRITALFGIDAIPCVIQNEFTNQGRTTAVDASLIEKIKEIYGEGIEARIAGGKKQLVYEMGKYNMLFIINKSGKVGEMNIFLADGAFGQ